MSCDEIQETLSLYADDGLTLAARSGCYEHLEVCPVCRAHLAELRSIRLGLAGLPRPTPPVDLIPAINNALAAEAAMQRVRSNVTIGDVVATWLQPRVMRYAFSSLTSLILFASVLVALRPHMIALHEASLSFNESQIANGPLDQLDIRNPISYAALRTPFNAESPSLNPGGALASLTMSATHLLDNSEQDADDMVVVADVFTNGSASVADVMHAPRDRRMLEEFQKALRTDAAFVPAALDHRPETMRVVFSLQRVNVRDRNF